MCLFTLALSASEPTKKALYSCKSGDVKTVERILEKSVQVAPSATVFIVDYQLAGYALVP
jgi:hypothetical protein